MWVSRYFVLFVIFSVCGWIYETIYCTIKDGYFQNRGFLFGPMCPIYGVGAALVTAVAEYLSINMGAELPWWEIFLVGVVGSIILEYGTSYVLEKLFHAVWWDYSDMPLNVHGRICAPASILFGLMAVFVYYVVFPWTLLVKASIPPLLMEFLSLVLMGFVSMDATLTVSALTNFAANVRSMGDAANQNMEMIYEAIKEKTAEAETSLHELRHSFTIANAKRVAGNMTNLHSSALNRVTSFKFPKPSVPYSEKIIEEIGKRRIRFELLSRKIRRKK